MITSQQRLSSRVRDICAWIECYCRQPGGSHRSKYVQLTSAQREMVRKLYDRVSASTPQPITGPLAAYIALVHLCGPESGRTPPAIETTDNEVWAATSARLREVLTREDKSITSLKFGTRYP